MTPTATKRPKTGGRASNPPQSFVCAQCGKPFEDYAVDVNLDAPACSLSCAAKMREKALGHASITLPCGNCQKPVTRPQSKAKGSGFNFFCNREAYLAARNGKAYECPK